MKKHYTTPTMEILQFNSQVVLNNASDAIRSNNGITFGGVDSNGMKDPSVKQRGFSDPVGDMVDDLELW